MSNTSEILSVQIQRSAAITGAADVGAGGRLS